MIATNGTPSQNGRGHDPSRLFQGGVDPITVNKLTEALNAATLSRQSLISSLTDQRRDINRECGYPESPTAEVFKNLFDRDPIANRVVSVLPKCCWQATPTVYEDESSKHATKFEAAWDELGSNLADGSSWHKDEQGSPIWERLRRLDIQSGIGSFGILLMGIDDNRNLEMPVEGMVTFNAKSVSVFKDVVTINTEGKRQVVKQRAGTRRIISPTGKGRLLPDSPITNAEMKELRNPTPKEGWYGRTDEKGKPIETDKKAAPSLTENEKRVLAGWEQDKAGMEQFGMVENGGVYTANKYMDFSPPLQTQWQPQVQPSDTRPNFASPPGGELAGTDQQYFGVSFGPPEMPAGKPSSKQHKLLFLRVFDETLVQVVRYEWNINNPRFGMPVMYRVTLNDPREFHSGVGLPLATVFVHWTRVIHVADNLNSSEIFGAPRMRAPLNRILDIQKIHAASGEGYWQSCFPILSLETHPQLGGDVIIDRTGIKNQMENIFQTLQRWAVTSGMSMKTLAPSVVDPTPHINGKIESICIYIPCPKRVFMGSERGELASGQDDSQFNDELRSRCHIHITPRIIVTFIDRLIMMGVLPEPGDDGYTVEWPDLDSLGEQAKATLFLTRVQGYAAALQGGLDQIFTPLDMMTKLDSMEEEQAEAILADAEKAVEEKMADDQATADEHGMVPKPPDGFQHPPPSPPPGIGQPGGPPVSPVKLNPGQQLVHPQTGQPVGGSMAPPKPNAPKPPVPQGAKPKPGGES